MCTCHSPLMRPDSGFLKEHVPWTPFQYKPLAPSNEETLLSFPSLPGTPCAILCLSLKLFNILCFHVFLLKFDFYPVQTQGTSWLVLWEPPQGPRPQPVYIKRKGKKDHTKDNSKSFRPMWTHLYLADTFHPIS